MQNSSITITKIELAEAIFDQVGLNKREAKEMIDSFYSCENLRICHFFCSLEENAVG